MDVPQSPRSELAEVLFRLRRTFYALAAFSGVINLLMLTPAVYMLQVYDRALVSSNVTTLLMLTVLVIGLYVLMALLEVVRSSVLIRVGNRLDMMLNKRIFGAAFERTCAAPAATRHRRCRISRRFASFLPVTACSPSSTPPGPPSSCW